MFDHIMCFAAVDDIPQRQPSVAAWDDEDGRTWMPVSCIIADAMLDNATGEVISPPIMAPGIWVVVRAASRQADLEDDPRCLIVTDSERAAEGLPFVLINKLQTDTPLGRITPVFAGDAYPIPQGPASLLVPLMVTA